MDDIFINEQPDSRDKIALFLKAYDRSINWLARSVHMSPSHLIRILNKQRKLTKKTLDKINETLQTNFTL